MKNILMFIVRMNSILMLIVSIFILVFSIMDIAVPKCIMLMFAAGCLISAVLNIYNSIKVKKNNRDR